MNPRLENAGFDAWLVRLFDDIDEANMNWIAALVQDCEGAFGDHLVDLVPSYTTLLVQFDPLTLDHGEARQLLQTLLARLAPLEDNSQNEVKALPVWYHPSVGPDLARVEQHTGLSAGRVIELHSGHTYRVFALGFAPGFAFMGTLPEQLETPRLESPRPHVPAGSVALAGRQTAAYPRATPGGWNLLGRTPATLFDPASQSLSLLRVGDRVRFEPVSRAEFERLGGDTTPMEAP
ncbi:5-oxoprolinase subunit PxpB [Oceanimonas sp. CHS3-5]|uniref:5-oxoprolinase subunit PxpB n=1 Tax=Oceanimonas sp. CHS3-5 TaxID=3068186 RepID=UPI00273DAA34|nr:5-oxoprolinase subunit PxpB [Oceanimonas sp. CHS3-5]MDP5293215.1 5-oxoprolinase subunit PxpB [Oceanimonas sp. CHS3-5]